jgi:hypothetical protein
VWSKIAQYGFTHEWPRVGPPSALESSFIVDECIGLAVIATHRQGHPQLHVARLGFLPRLVAESSCAAAPYMLSAFVFFNRHLIAKHCQLVGKALAN